MRGVARRNPHDITTHDVRTRASQTSLFKAPGNLCNIPRTISSECAFVSAVIQVSHSMHERISICYRGSSVRCRSLRLAALAALWPSLDVHPSLAQAHGRQKKTEALQQYQCACNGHTEPSPPDVAPDTIEVRVCQHRWMPAKPRGPAGRSMGLVMCGPNGRMHVRRLCTCTCLCTHDRSNKGRGRGFPW